MKLSIKPLTPTCTRSYEEREHVCIGISPYNSKFSTEYISELISWGMSNFKSFHVFLPDAPTIYTLQALGYDEAKANKKLKKQINCLKNKIKNGLINNGIAEDKHSHYVLNWEALNQLSNYKAELASIYELFDTDSEFRKECLKASKWVLEGKISVEELTDERLLIAVKYFLAELPLFAKTPLILNKKFSLFCYHQSIDIHESLYTNKLSYIPDLGQGYGVINCD